MMTLNQRIIKVSNIIAEDNNIDFSKKIDRINFSIEQISLWKRTVIFVSYNIDMKGKYITLADLTDKEKEEILAELEKMI